MFVNHGHLIGTYGNSSRHPEPIVDYQCLGDAFQGHLWDVTERYTPDIPKHRPAQLEYFYAPNQNRTAGLTRLLMSIWRSCYPQK